MTRISQARTTLLMAAILSSTTYCALLCQAPSEPTGPMIAERCKSSDIPPDEVRRMASTGHLREELEFAADYYAGAASTRICRRLHIGIRRLLSRAIRVPRSTWDISALQAVGVKADPERAGSGFSGLPRQARPTAS